MVIDSFGDECEIVLFQIVKVISDQIGYLPTLQKIQLMVVVKVDHRHFGPNRIYLMFKEINLVRVENCHLCSNPSGGCPENLIVSIIARLFRKVNQFFVFFSETSLKST